LNSVSIVPMLPECVSECDLASATSLLRIGLSE